MCVSSKWLLDICMRRKQWVGFGLALSVTLLVVWLSLPMCQMALAGWGNLLSVSQLSTLRNQARLHQLRFAKSSEFSRWHW